MTTMKILQIENKTGKVKLDDTVDSYSRRKLAEEMAKVFGAEAFANPEFTNLTNASENEVDRLEIEINSPGGSVLDGLLIVNELRAMSARGVRTVAIVNVLAASMGSVIAASCDECLIAPNGRMMIHDVSVGVRGTAKDLSRMSALCEELSNEIANIYAAKTAMTVESCRSLMLYETWMDAEKCIALGFADGMFDFRAEVSKVQPMSLIDRLTNPSNAESLERISELENTIADRDAAVATMSARITELEAANEDAIAAKVLLGEQLEKAKENLTTANEYSAKLIDDLETAEKAVDDLKTAYMGALDNHAQELAAANDSAAKRAAEIAADAGFHKALPIDGDAPTNHLDTFNSLTGAAQAAYFRANRGAILAEQQARKNQ
jgi:ATP-dependent protease ClpP protease subunit